METATFQSNNHYECLQDTKDWIDNNISTYWIVSITHVIHDAIWYTTIVYKG